MTRGRRFAGLGSGVAVHNEQMRTLVRTAVVAVILSVALSGCGADAKSTDSAQTSPGATPSGVTVPAGVALSPYGTELKFGEPATVGYAPNAIRATVLKLTVLSVTQGSVADLSGYTLNDRMRQSTPFYVQVAVENLGIGDVGKTPVPLALEDNRKALILPSTFTDNFAKCPSTPFPTTFAPKAKASFCLVYLTPDHGTFSAMSFRPSQAFEPIRWTGALTVVKTKKGKSS